jgi:hypothetical protein
MNIANVIPLHTPSTLRIRARLPDRYQGAFDSEIVRWAHAGHDHNGIEAYYAIHGPEDPEINSYAGLRNIPQPMQDSLAAAQQRKRGARRHSRQYGVKSSPMSPSPKDGKGLGENMKLAGSDSDVQADNLDERSQV